MEMEQTDYMLRNYKHMEISVCQKGNMETFSGN